MIEHRYSIPPRSKSGSLAMLGRLPKLTRLWLTQAMSVVADWLFPSLQSNIWEGEVRAFLIAMVDKH